MIDGKKHFFIVGICGVGMTAIAQILRHRGHVVEGSDTGETFFTSSVLAREGIPVRVGFRPENIPPDCDAVIHSTAYGPETPDLQEAVRRHVPIFSYPEILGMLFDRSEGVSIAGSHGKTTTTALAGVLLSAAGKDPTVVVGSAVADFHGNARIGKGKLLVVETDEYQNKFTKYAPRHLLVTNIDYDHPDFFRSKEAYIAAFDCFIKKLPRDGILVTNGDDPTLESILRSLRRSSIRFGKSGAADVQLLSCAWESDHQYIVVRAFGNEFAFALPLPGEYNAMNATAAIALAFPLGAREEHLSSLATFQGLARRFVVRAVVSGIPIIEDYAHHPAEIRAAISGARQRWPNRRILAVFQPHTFSRTRAFLADFGAALSTADCVILLDIYASVREKDPGGIASSDIRKAMKKPGNAVCVPGVEEAVSALRRVMTPDDVVLLLGAGNVWQIADRFT